VWAWSSQRLIDGITYLALMFSIVLIGISVSAATRQWTVMVQREKEADLIAKGIEIQNALALYSATMQVGRVMPNEMYPQSLAELTRAYKPFLRRVLSGSDEQAETGSIPACADWWDYGGPEQKQRQTDQGTGLPPLGSPLRRPKDVSRLDVSTSQSFLACRC
jgi:type II secretory pathway pseudopilin PulG